MGIWGPLALAGGLCLICFICFLIGQMRRRDWVKRNNALPPLWLLLYCLYGCYY